MLLKFSFFSKGCSVTTQTKTKSKKKCVSPVNMEKEMTFLNWAMWKARVTGKPYCKSGVRGPSLYFYVSFCLYMQTPVLAVLENVRLWTGRRWRAVGKGVVGAGLVEVRAEEWCFWGFFFFYFIFRRHVCPTFLHILDKFSPSSWNTAPSFSILLWHGGALRPCSYRVCALKFKPSVRPWMVPGPLRSKNKFSVIYKHFSNELWMNSF